jgi:hypothetical protein
MIGPKALFSVSIPKNDVRDKAPSEIRHVSRIFVNWIWFRTREWKTAD